LLSIQVRYAKLVRPETFVKALLDLVPWVILIQTEKILTILEMAEESRQVLCFKINKASETFAKALLALVPWVILLQIEKLLAI
jgi:hypothetical protein